MGGHYSTNIASSDGWLLGGIKGSMISGWWKPDVVGMSSWNWGSLDREFRSRLAFSAYRPVANSDQIPKSLVY